MYDETLQNRRNNKEPYTGNLIKAVKGGLTELSFKYKIIKSNDYFVQNSLLPGHEYVQPTMQIYTSRIDYSFASGDKIRLHTGRIMTLKNISEVEDESKAMFTGDGLIGYQLYLEGGGK